MKKIVGLNIVGRFHVRCKCGALTSQAYALKHGMSCTRCYTAKQLREALEQLAACAQEVVDSWEHGDLAGAVNGLEGALENAKPLLR